MLVADSGVYCNRPAIRTVTGVRCEEVAGMGADSCFSGKSNAMLKKILTHGSRVLE